jgi:tetrahydromethanopterin S-methyltransferase subunit G
MEDNKLDQLAAMIANGFHEVHEKIEELGTKVDEGFGEVNQCLERIEKSVASHERRIDTLEDFKRQVKTKLQLPN